MVPGASHNLNWSGVSKALGQPRRFTSGLGVTPIVGNTVTVTPKNLFVSGLPAVISYSAAIVDVISLASGVRAEPFVDFPIT